MPAPQASNCALILVDVIMSFFDPDGPHYYPEASQVLAPVAELLSIARDNDTLVVHAVERHYPGLLDFEHAKLPHHCEIGARDSRYVPGFEPVSRTREIEIPKRRYSSFYATDLDLVLREQGVTRIVVAGVKTNVCIRATVQDAFAGGFEVLLPAVATNSNRPHLAAASLEDIDRYFGRVVGLPEALKAVAA